VCAVGPTGSDELVGGGSDKDEGEGNGGRGEGEGEGGEGRGGGEGGEGKGGTSGTSDAGASMLSSTHEIHPGLCKLAFLRLRRP